MPFNFTERFPYEYNYSFAFNFELQFFDKDSLIARRQWVNQHWYYSIVYACIYITLVHVGQRMMRNREKIRLNRALVAWNFLIASFSIAGTLRFLPSFIQILRVRGVTHSVCVLTCMHGVCACWAWFYLLSKVIELVDTAFIVLRKQKLIFLHWYLKRALAIKYSMLGPSVF